MKRILISLSIIGAVAAIAGGVTYALFSDTETSTGNIFVAGDLDLKVDHKYSMYNGHECTSQCVEQLGTDLMKNGSFEVPEVTDPAKWEIFVTGTSGLEWTVEWNGGSASYLGRPRPEPALVEYHENVMTGSAADGDQYAELDSDWYGPNDPLNGEPALIKIYQNIPTTVGAKYRLHYYYAPRPSTAVGENILDVEINDVNVAHHDLGGGGGSIVWQEYTYEFFATNASTKVEFIGGGINNSLGVFLDYVTLHPYICKYEVIGGQCNLWEEKDLGNGDFFWNFDDVKPGDYGTNIISMHVFGNNAYGCLLVSDSQDNENDIVDPEINAGDDQASTTGELSQFLNVAVWIDGIQNNTHDNAELFLYGPNLPLKDMKNMAKLPLTATTTAYIGVAWCFGDQTVDANGDIHCSGVGTQDIAQTDSFLASLTAYAEQQKNNENFSCANVIILP